MTTDITELALLVSKAKASVFTLEYISQFEPADIDSDDVDLRFEVDGRDTGTNVSIVDECGQAAKVIGTLVEALEKAQAQSSKWLEAYHKAVSIGARYEERIAELVSRAVTVKLPQRLQPGADGWDDWYVHSDDEGEYLKFDDVLAMLTAAGIKVEDE